MPSTISRDPLLHRKPFPRWFGGSLTSLLLATAVLLSGSPVVADSAPTVLPNGWKLTPAGRTIGLAGDMPAAMVLAPDGRNLLVTTAGYHDHSISVVGLASGRVVQTIEVGKNWFGMAVDPASGDVLVPGGGPARADFLTEIKPDQVPLARAEIHRFSFAAGRLRPEPGVTIDGLKDADLWTAGLACGRGGALYAVNTDNDTVYALKGGAVTGSARVGYRPLACALSPDGGVLAVTNWGDRSVSLLRAASLKEIARVPVGSHPCAAVWARAPGKPARLFVANSGSNSVSVVASSSVGAAESGRPAYRAESGWHVTETISTALTVDAPVGSTPLALAASHDGRRLFVANADNNDVAVADISDPRASRVLGFIPTGWYPSAVAVSRDDRTLYVGVGKGLSSRPNSPARTGDGYTQPDGSGHSDYVGDCLAGGVSVVAMPDASTLAHYTRQAAANVPNRGVPAATPPVAVAAFRRIQHVLYIIRENRTYDQVFGDIRAGNGDPDLVLFGRKVTPNAHALAAQTVLLDNLYTNGEVSQDGHQWCNAAYATDFTEKAWENNYTGRGQPDADDRLSESPGGYLWDDCRRHGLTYRSYGEFADFQSSPGAPPTFTGEETLRGHASAGFTEVPRFDGGRDQGRARVFVDELRAAEKSGAWPNFMVMHLGEDHTKGLSAGAFTPVAYVADNDQALGRIVEAVSHSRFWASTAIFVIEDDAQDGPDHVDCHRTVGLVISPYVKRGLVDHTHYTTASFVRTMELILRLPPMSQYDKYATPLGRCFAARPDTEAFADVPAQVDLEARNPRAGPGAAASAKLDFSDVDRADPQALNHILWDALRPGTPMPAPVRSAWSGPAGALTASAEVLPDVRRGRKGAQ